MQTARLDFNKMSLVIPDEIRSQKAWVGYVTREDNGRIDKIPMNVMTGMPAKSNDPSTWTDFEMALDLAIQRNYAGIGFMFQPPYVGVDIDHCVKDGAIEMYALEILKALNSYSEYSPSGTGIHTLCKGEIPRACKISKIGLEIYTKGRFFTVTGNRLENYPAELNECTDALKGIFSRFVDKAPANDILSLIANSKDAERFQRIYSGQWQNDYPSQSEADLALCNKLAFWTGKDAGQMDSLFRQSGLMRPKWDEKHFSDGKTYGQVLIEKANEGCENTFQSSGSEFKHKPTQGEIITRDCEENSKDFFRDQHGNSILVLPVDNHLEVCLTNTSSFRNWTATRYRKRFGVPPKIDAINQAKVQLEARCATSRQVELFNRVGWHDNKIFYDLTAVDHKGVEVSASGWRVTQLPPIFRRYQHQVEQVTPAQGGDAKDFLRFCNIAGEDSCLLLTAIASYFIPNFPHVIISMTGEQGTAKSSNSRKIKELVDPSRVILTSSPKELEQAQLTADKHWVCAFDNVSRIHDWFSDFLCRGVTGEGDMKRSLYTNDDEFIRSYRRCFVLNGIGSIMYRPDLLDRSIIFDIPLLKESWPESFITDEWKKSLPGILGGFLTAVSRAMGVVAQVSGHEKFRMADFARWGGALSEGLGYSRDEFFSKYQESVDSKWQDTAEESTFAKKIKTFFESHGGYWAGSPSELLSEISSDDDEKGIPKTAKWLSNELIRIAPVMRHVGIDIIKDKRQGGTGRRIFILKKCAPQSREDGVSISEFCEDDSEVDSDRPF
ncbi:MAG: hypothetical protein PHI58_03620 [Candidatus Omnitrophica bacterium]|nr:hypothetical protein [Candidatus Omnitrophota bacterium]